MRMEELSDNRYIKGTDTVERYLLNLVEEYFKTSNIAATTSREYIIKKAVERMKDEISFDSIGVLSITLPDGEKRTGAVTITLEDLNGEPLIPQKLAAFNVNFGSEENTACEGNDPRLSDARKPLDHQHEISDITGLSGILSTLTTKAERAEAFLHKHQNKSLLDILVYTGDKTKIDLSTLDTLESKVREVAEKVQNDIAECEQVVNTKINEMNQTVSQVRQEIKTITDAFAESNKQYSTETKTYADNQIVSLQEFIQKELDKLVLASEMNNFKQVLNNCYTLAGKMEIPFNSVIKKFSGESIYNGSTFISADILQELSKRGAALQDCQIEILMSYVQDGKTIYRELPYIIMTNYLFDGAFSVGTNYTDNTISVNVELSRSSTIPEEIKECNIIYNVYSKHNTLLV